jgi:S-formylglutathione hydrolase FrmB
VLRFSLVSAGTLLAVYAAAGTLVLLTLRRPRRARTWWRWVGGATALGAGVGALLSWWLGDVEDVLGVSPTWVDRLWVGALLAVVGAAVVAVVRGGAGRRVTAASTVVVMALATGLAINRDGGLFPTVGSLLGISDVPALVVPPGETSAVRAGDTSTPAAPDLGRTWRAPDDLPARGRLGSVEIPGTTSHFDARDALVYLPPAALVADPPPLPVDVVLSGQGPGAAPENLVDAGRVVETLDALARSHDGLAPIVVMPDQLERPTNNPMCVDGPLGNSRTYLTVDVPRWITTHLSVQAPGRAWAVSGFSQGGTCSLQLAAGRPDLFASFVDVSGQLGPRLDGGVRATVERGFDGDRAAWAAAQPLAVLAARAPYADSAGFFAVGQTDSRYGPVMPVVSAAARSAGMAVTRDVVPRSGHDWATASTGLGTGTSWLEGRLGLSR